MTKHVCKLYNDKYSVSRKLYCVCSGLELDFHSFSIRPSRQAHENSYFRKSGNCVINISCKIFGGSSGGSGITGSYYVPLSL